MAHLLKLPTELLHDVVSRLLLPDQASFAGACKFLHAQLTPTVWKEIELHHCGVHEGLVLWPWLDYDGYGGSGDDEDECSEVEVSEEYPFAYCISKPSDRKYAQSDKDRGRWRTLAKKRYYEGYERRQRESVGRATDNCNRKAYQFNREEIFLGVKMQFASPSRWVELAANVQSLCMSMAVDHEVCLMLADLVNLRSLQLVGLPLEKEWGDGMHARADDTPRQPLPVMSFPALCKLRLRAYIPTHLVRAILTSNASTITHLDLGLLAGPKEDKENVHLKSWNADDDSDSDEDSDYEDDDDKRPWSIHSPHWLQGATSLPTPLSSLTHLHLIKPYNGETYSSSWTSDSFADIPEEYDEVTYKEWAAILDSAASTLKEAIFEQRVVLEAGDTVGDGDPHPERKGSQWRQDPDAADVMFCENILRRLLVGGRIQFPHLQHLGLRGVRIRKIQTLEEEIDGTEYPGVGNVPSNKQRLKTALPGCDIEYFELSYPLHVYAGWIYQNWPQSRHEARQDPGDGLLADESFYNNYRRRFGPDWRIIDE